MRKPIDQCTKRKIISGRLAGNEILVEDTIQGMEGGKPTNLVELSNRGNLAAYNALVLDGYTDSDTLYYGRIGDYGHIVAEKDLER